MTAAHSSVLAIERWARLPGLWRRYLILFFFLSILFSPFPHLDAGDVHWEVGPIRGTSCPKSTCYASEARNVGERYRVLHI